MKEIFKITMSLTAVCVAAALILGVVFAKTDHARKVNEEKMKDETIQGLLGFGGGQKAPEDLKIFPISRYVVRDPKGEIFLAYAIPLKEKGYSVLQIDLTGKPVAKYNLSATSDQLAEEGSRERVVEDVLPKGSKATYAETLYFANRAGKRMGYVIPGKTQGFKTFVKYMVSTDADFTLTGIAITESEEDPGLGAEIQQDYFRNQFAGKTQEILKNLKVIKEPLPEDYDAVLDPAKAKKKGLSPEKIREVKQKHLKDDIYALTGATISTRAVTNGVKDTVRKFVYRIGIMDQAIKAENIGAAF